MGADRTLVAAAGKMAPAKVDYSNLFTGINAIGKMIATKTNIANEILAQMPEGIDVSELPEEMRDANMEFFEDSKQDYQKAVKAMKFSAPFTKKYRNAVSEINKIKGGYEKIKQDLVSYAEYRTKVFTEHTTQSKQANATEKNYYADLVIQGGKMNADVKFTLDGLKFGSDELGLGDLPEIYSSSVGIKAGDMARNIILNYGKNIKLKDGVFSEEETRDAAENLLDTLHAEGGWRAVKSLAFDAKFDGRSFMQHFGDELILGDDDMGGEYNSLSVNAALKQWQSNNPNASQSEINAMQDNMLADAWDIDQNDKINNDIVDFVVNRTKKKFDDTTYVSPDEKNLETHYQMPGGQYFKKENVDIDINYLNSNKDFPQQISYNKVPYSRKGGNYYYFDTNPNSKTYNQEVLTTKNSLATMLQVISGPYGYIRDDVPFGTPGSDVKDYKPFEGTDGNLVTNPLLIQSLPDKDGYVDVFDLENRKQHRVKLNDLKPNL